MDDNRIDDNRISEECATRLRRIAVMRNLVNAPEETISALVELIREHGEVYIERELAEVAKLLPTPKLVLPSDKIAEFLSLAKMLGET